MIPELQMAIGVLIESQLGQRLVLVGQGCDAVDLVDLGGGAAAVAYRSIPRHQILMYIAIVAQQHALADRVHATADGAALRLQQCAVESTLREEDSRVRTVQVIVVEVLHHEEGPPTLLLTWQEKLIVHWQRAIIERRCQEIRAEVVARVVEVGTTDQPVECAFAPRLLLRAILLAGDVPQVFIISKRSANLADWHLMLLHIPLEHLLKCLLAHEHKLVVLAQGLQFLEGEEAVLAVRVLSHVEILDIILATISLDLTDLIDDGLFVHLIGHLAVEDDLVFVIAHLVELFISQLALAL